MKKAFTITTICLGLITLQIKANIADTTHLQKIDEIVITGSNHATSRNLLPYTVSLISNKQIEATGRTQLLSAITGEVPSLFVSQRNIFGFGVSNGGSGGIKIRGVGGSPTSGILMMVDGQPQFAGLYSHPVADFYESEYVDHVEILRGPGSVLYGSNAMGGVINVITKQTKKDAISTVLTSQYGSYNTWQSSLTNTIKKGRFSSLISLGYDRTDGLQDNFDFKQKSLYAKIGYEVDKNWNIGADYSLMNFIGNDPIYAKLSNPDSKDIYHQNITRGEASVSLTNRYKNTNGVLRSYYSYGNHYIDDPRHFHSLDDRFGVLAYQNFTPWKGNMSTLGFDFNTYTGQIPISGGHNYGDGSQQAKMQTINKKSITEYSPYLTLSQEFWKGILILNGGIRMANSDMFGTKWIPQIGFSVHPGYDWTLKASLAKGYRNPSFREMYLYRMANPDLDPENMMNYEVTIGKHFSNLFDINLTGYISKGSNMIETVNMKNINTGSFTNKGVELTALSQPMTNLTIRASYSYLHTSLPNLTAAPKNQYFWGISWYPIKQLSIDTQLKGVGGLFVSEDVKHQNYALLDLRMTYNICKWVDVFVNLDNITDAKYMINKGYEMPGFTVSGGVKIKL